LRLVETRLRVVMNRAADELPEDGAEVAKLARRLGYATGGEFLAALDGHTRRVREAFVRLCDRARG
jgi:glutamine synthetase adenylyltransferase